MKSSFHSDTYRKRQEAEIEGEDLKEFFLLMYEVQRGNLTAAAKAANVSRGAVYLWREDKDWAAEMDALKVDTEEGRLDRAEESVDRLVGVDDGATSRWFLDRKGRDRGYGQVVRQRHGGVDGPAIKVDVEGDYPPRAASLEDWETQQEASRARLKAKRDAEQAARDDGNEL